MRRLLCLAGVLLVVACNSVLDIPEAHPQTVQVPDEPDPGGGDDDDNGGECGEGEKSCGTRCVQTGDPSTGCGGDSCDPCNVAHAMAVCNEGQCAVGGCNAGFLDCNGDPKDGCEVDSTSDRANCGECKNACQGDLPCSESQCRCDGEDQCGFDGDCDTDLNQCICGQKGNGDDRLCSRGAPCDGEDSCAF